MCNLRLNLYWIRARERQILCRLDEEVFHVFLVVKKWLKAYNSDFDLIFTVWCLYELVSPGYSTKEITNCVFDILYRVELRQTIDEAWLNVYCEVAISLVRLKRSFCVVVPNIYLAQDCDGISPDSRNIRSFWHHKFALSLIMDGPDWQT